MPRCDREMLKSALKAWLIDNRLKVTIANEIEWVLNKCEDLSDKRNDALHCPLNILMNTSTLEFSIEPDYLTSHPRASKLRGKDVFDEFSRYRAQTECLQQYAQAMWLHLFSETPLPQRPKLPNTGAKKNPTEQPYQEPSP